LVVQPDNLAVLLDKLNRAVRLSDRAVVDKTLDRVKYLSQGWKEEGRAALTKCERELAAKLGPDAAVETLLMTNLIRSEPSFGRGLTEVDPGKLPGVPLYRFVLLTPAPHEAAAPDLDLNFTATPLPESLAGKWDAALPVWLTGVGNPVVFAANAKELR